MNSEKMIEVVSAIIIRNGRILLTQRKALQDFAFTWECPGGKVEGNESHHEAITREIAQEIGSKAIALAQQSTWCGWFENAVSRPDRAKVFLLMYRVNLDHYNTAPLPREGQGIGWFTADEMERLTLSPGNKAALEKIKTAMWYAEKETVQGIARVLNRNV